MNITELVKTAHENAKQKGFHEESYSPLHYLMLINCELAEAAEEYREHGDILGAYTNEKGKPLGFPIELADAVIRIADLCGKYDIDLETAIKTKIEYNKTREFKHGKKC